MDDAKRIVDRLVEEQKADLALLDRVCSLLSATVRKLAILNQLKRD